MWSDVRRINFYTVMRSLFQPEIFECEIIGSESLFKKEGEKRRGKRKVYYNNIYNDVICLKK